MLRDRLLTLQQSVSLCTSSLYDDSTVLVSSVRTTSHRWTRWCGPSVRCYIASAVHTADSWLSTLSFGAPVLSVVVPDRQEVQDLITEAGVQAQKVKLPNQVLLRDDGVECWTTIYEQHSDVRAFIVQVSEGHMECGGDSFNGWAFWVDTQTAAGPVRGQNGLDVPHHICLHIR